MPAPTKAKTPTPQTTAAKDTGVFLYVTDSSAVDPEKPRVHDIVTNGQIERITFKYAKPTKLPYVKGIKFLRDGFVVRDEDENIITMPKDTNDNTLADIGPDCVVASLDELSKEALFKRCVRYPEASTFSIGTPVGVMITFLKDKNEKRLWGVKAEQKKSSIGIEEMDEDDLDKLGLEL